MTSMCYVDGSFALLTKDFRTIHKQVSTNDETECTNMSYHTLNTTTGMFLETLNKIYERMNEYE